MIGSDIVTLGINYRFGVKLTGSQTARAMTVACAKDLDSPKTSSQLAPNCATEDPKDDRPWLHSDMGPAASRPLSGHPCRRCDLRCGGCLTWEKSPGDEMTPAELARLCSACRTSPGSTSPAVRPCSAPTSKSTWGSPAATPRLQASLPHERLVSRPGSRLRRARPATTARALAVTHRQHRRTEALHDKMRGREGSTAPLSTFERLREIPGVEVC